MTLTSSLSHQDPILRGENLFQIMETERAHIPNILFEEYFPVFVVNCLNEKLNPESYEGLPSEARHRGLGKAQKNSEDDGSTFFESDGTDFEGQFLLPQAKLNDLGRIARFALDVISAYYLDKLGLVKTFTEEFRKPCVELLYLLDVKYKLVPLQGYMLRLKEPSQISQFKSNFLSFCFSSNSSTFSIEDRNRSCMILDHFIKRILLIHYCNPGGKPKLENAKIWTGEILNEIFSKLVCDDDVGRLCPETQQILLRSIMDCCVPVSVKRRCFKEHLIKNLCHSAEPVCPNTEVFQKQEDHADPTKLLLADNFRQSVSQMIRTALSSSDVIEIFTAVLKEDVNWELVLNFASVCIEEREKNLTSPLKELIKTFVREGLVEKTERKIKIAFILARHCSLVSPEIFFRYEKWFLNTFESEVYSPANEPETFEYLTSILSDWVPLEPCCFLRAQVAFWPFIPKGCRNIWTEYVQLARTRISELTLSEESSTFVLNENDPLQHQVAQAVKGFEQTGKIPAIVHKLFIFQKKEYLENFLPMLLRQPTGVSLSDARLRLIELLNKQGKIAPDLYAKYKEGTRRKS